MNLQTRRYLWSLVIGLILTALTIVFASVTNSFIGVFLWPGMAAAAIIFPQGIHSDSGNTYLVLAGVFNSFLYSWPVFGVIILISRLRRNRDERR